MKGKEKDSHGCVGAVEPDARTVIEKICTLVI